MLSHEALPPGLQDPSKSNWYGFIVIPPGTGKLRSAFAPALFNRPIKKSLSLDRIVQPLLGKPLEQSFILQDPVPEKFVLEDLPLSGLEQDIVCPI
jgi:hypothetical protein